MMKTIEQTAKWYDLSLSKLRLDGGTQPRVELDAEWVAFLADAVKHENDADMEVVPELVAFHDGSNYWLAEGFHRYFARKKAGQKTARTRVYTGTLQDAILYAAGTNFKHGKPRTSADIRHAVRMILANAEWREWSNSEIARRVRIASHHVVADEKRKLAEEEKRQRDAEREAERKRKEAEKAKKNASRSNGATTTTANPSLGSNPSENGQPSGAPAEPQTTVYRNKYGKVSSMRTANIGGVRVKLIEVETEAGQIAGLDKQIPRSRKKYVVQCLKRGMTEEEILADVQEEIKRNPVKR